MVIEIRPFSVWFLFVYVAHSTWQPSKMRGDGKKNAVHTVYLVNVSACLTHDYER